MVLKGAAELLTDTEVSKLKNKIIKRTGTSLRFVNGVLGKHCRSGNKEYFLLHIISIYRKLNSQEPYM